MLNRLKALRGELPALQDPVLMGAKRLQEQQVRANSSAAPWLATEAAAEALRRHYPAWRAMQPMRGSLIAQALNLVTLRDEAQRPAADRLHAFSGGRGARELTQLRAQVPHPQALEEARLRAFIERAQAALPAGHAQHEFVSALLGGQPDAASAARHWLARTRMHDVQERTRWLALNETDFAQLDDPLLQLAQRLHALRRPVLWAYEQESERRIRQLSGALAQARWQLLGDTEAPDATGTLRLSYGRVRAPSPGRFMESWKTTLTGLYARSEAFSGQAPFDLAPRLAQRRHALLASHAATPINFTSDVDIIGGNSGSPVLNARGELVGLAFDSNLDSLAGRFAFDGRSNRMLSVSLEAIFLALEQVYDAGHLAREIKARR